MRDCDSTTDLVQPMDPSTTSLADQLEGDTDCYNCYASLSIMAKTLRVHCDNTISITYINNFGGTTSPELMALARRIWNFRLKHQHTSTAYIHPFCVRPGRRTITTIQSTDLNGSWHGSTSRNSITSGIHTTWIYLRQSTTHTRLGVRHRHRRFDDTLKTSGQSLPLPPRNPVKACMKKLHSEKRVRPSSLLRRYHEEILFGGKVVLALGCIWFFPSIRHRTNCWIMNILNAHQPQSIHSSLPCRKPFPTFSKLDINYLMPSIATRLFGTRTMRQQPYQIDHVTASSTEEQGTDQGSGLGIFVGCVCWYSG
ncbi:hypothetical protein BDB00DRAFT_870755 [Zychaea mexicana]|uniref:uncharacterized protein n=1 Tax=Zychaea mexicana TaxID=64656 RepID=UPI0022FE58A0|nr:uncharacterized protein BDB00DRAFT_870755 [Zychaea mexicana]KAI9495041.1 hypothetical protein BDB00DRAFT_870755 [Zychaea mexicana]